MKKMLFFSVSLLVGCLPQLGYGFNQADIGRIDRGENCQNCDFSGANFTQKNIKGADLSRSNFSSATFGELGATMLKGTNLSGANLTNAQFILGDRAGSLWYGNFHQANLTKATFSGKFLLNNNFSEAILNETSFVGTPANPLIFRGVNFKEAKFTKTKFINAEFESGLNLHGAVFKDVDLTGATYLEELQPGKFKREIKPLTREWLISQGAIFELSAAASSASDQPPSYEEVMGKTQR